VKVVILAGGLGTRISEYTKSIPKPMVSINGKPLLIRIMNYFYNNGFDDFYIALGYKGKIIKDYFKKNKKKWKVKLVDTGKNTMTGGRLKRLSKYLKDERFIMTYGDGLSTVNLKKLLKFHKQNKKKVTLTAVRPPARFGYLKLKGNLVNYFKEKSRTDEGWINGGFFIMEPSFLKLIKKDSTYLEREPLEKATRQKNLAAFKHNDFWQCVDTIRDKTNLESAIKKKRLKKIFD
tara:strand:+ start:81 stop:782 length:702 start_codon:yes stop_codon:yes gene_type:complete